MTTPLPTTRSPLWTLIQLATEYDHLRKAYLGLLKEFNTKDEEHEKRISALEISIEANRKKLEEQRKESKAQSEALNELSYTRKDQNNV